jgi:hypothetical protein
MCFVGIETVYRSESKTQVVNFLVKMINAMGKFLEVLCYDDMCHLASFIHNRVHMNSNMGFLDGLRKYIDRFHCETIETRSVRGSMILTLIRHLMV